MKPNPAASHRPGAAPAQKEYFQLIASNRRARHDYHIEETYEAGIALHGSEVKSLRTHRVSFADSYAKVEGGECWLLGLQLGTYEKTHVQIPLPDRPRRLLLKKREIAKLQSRSERAGCTLVPLEVYFKGRWAKLKLAVARGKSQYDKRQTLRAALAERDMDRAMKQGRRRNGRTARMKDEG